MLNTQQPVLRRFWYATVPVDALSTGPKPFTLLGENLAIFIGADGLPAALQDRCCHRTAKLSRGRIENGNVICGYHGWEYDRTGKLVKIPQMPAGQPLPNAQVKSYYAESKYGYVWVALDAPLRPIPTVPEDADPAYRRIQQFYETWNTSSLRFIENSFDNAHFAFVHRGTFGVATAVTPEKYELIETDFGFAAESTVPVVNPPQVARITGVSDPQTTRHMRNEWYMPFCRRLDMEYPSGIRHIIINSATPIDDRSIQVVQILYRNDREEDCSTRELIDWDAAIILEDKDALESTDPDAIVDVSRRIEMHMPSDRPGLLVRKRLMALLEEHGEVEVPRAAE